MNNNTMPPHNKHVVNMLEVEKRKKLVSWVDELTTPLVDIKNQLLMNHLSLVCNAACEHCLIDRQNCEVLKYGIQELMNQVFIVVGHLSTSPEVAKLEISYDQVQPLQNSLWSVTNDHFC